jgi:4-hydroxy-4-methyl-2-oxoglutarate aldolase
MNNLNQISKISTASLHEAAGKIGSLPSVIKPLSPNFRLNGKAFTVQSPPGDNLWIHRAIYAACPGDVLIVQVSGQIENGYFGEIMAYAAKERGLSGLVIDGGVRDSQLLIAMGFPVFSIGVCISGTTKDPDGCGSLGQPIKIGDILVQTGDIVVGDADGVMIVPQDIAEDVVSHSLERDEAEIDIIQRLKNGESTIDIYGLPPLEK